MKHTLMLTHNVLPPAQAEALYETLPDLAGPTRAGSASAWPGEDWLNDDASSGFARATPASFPALPTHPVPPHPKPRLR